MPKRKDPFAALGDTTRRAVLDVLRERGELTAGEIASEFPKISRPAVSRHLRVLREAKLVRAREAGREWIYTLDAGALARLYYDWFERFASMWETSLEALKRQVESDKEAPS